MTDYALHVNTTTSDTTSQSVNNPTVVVDEMVKSSASLDNVIGLQDQSDESAAIPKRLTVLVCGNVDLKTEGIADKLHVNICE